jgi:FAD/FMN-containing dehydrogenase
VTTSAPDRALTRAQLPDDLQAVAVTPQDPFYRDHAPTFFRGGAPAIILQARHAEHVRSAVLLAAKHPDLPFSIRSGGHGVSGRSTNHGGIVLDLAAMNDIALPDPGTGVVQVEPGARWLDVARTLQPHGLGISSGDYGGVGVGGLATAGGAGWLVREHGLTIDRVQAVEMVLANGSSVRADATTLPDLFWAVRGAGSNFGVVTALEIAASPVSAVGYAQFVLVADDAAQLLVDWGTALESAPPPGHQLADPRAHTPRPTGCGAGQHRRAQRTARGDPRVAGAFRRRRAAGPAVRAGGALLARDRQRLPGAAPGGGRAARPGCRGPAHHRRPRARFRRAAGQW